MRNSVSLGNSVHTEFRKKNTEFRNFFSAEFREKIPQNSGGIPYHGIPLDYKDLDSDPGNPRELSENTALDLMMKIALGQFDMFSKRLNLYAKILQKNGSVNTGLVA